MSHQVHTKLKRVQYAPEKMTAALHAVRSGTMSKAKASRAYGVPRTTLTDKLLGKVPEGPTPTGPSPVLNQQEETLLSNYIVGMHNIGYPLTKAEFLLEVKKILDVDGRKTPFTNNMPGKDWYKAFLRRNPGLSLRTPQALGHERAAVTLSMINSWYCKLLDFLKEEVPDSKSLLEDPRRIFNADESGFPLCVKSDRVLAPTGSKHVYQVVVSNKTQITVMACMNAIGDYMSPLILYPGERFRDVGIAKFPEAIFAHTSNGWMDTECFVSFLEHLHKFLCEKNIPTPILFIVDGHSTHISLQASKFCRDNGIILYCLLPNATHILQACDVGLFSPMKSVWATQVKAWQMEHIGEILTKRIFPEVFRTTWYKVATLDNAIKGFRKSGLFPLSVDGIDKSKLNPSTCIQDSPTATSSNSEEASDKVFTFSPPIPINLESIDTEDQNQMQVPSKAFESLQTPVILKKERKNLTIREKLPKALSGAEAIAILEEREREKEENVIAKQQRKEEREKKRLDREAEKERKQQEKERKKLEKAKAKASKQKGKGKKRRHSSESECDKENIPYMDTSDESCASGFCVTCGKSGGAPSQWVGCENCPNWYHIQCCNDEMMRTLTEDAIQDYPFVCLECL